MMTNEKAFKSKLEALAHYYDAEAPILYVVGKAKEELDEKKVKCESEELIKFLYIHEAEIIDIKKRLKEKK